MPRTKTTGAKTKTPAAKKKDYRAKRKFDETPEPQPEGTRAFDGDVDPGTARPGESFVIQQHHATRLHFDLRLEMFNGNTPVLVSWAVPRNLPREKGKPTLAVHVEDHPIEYATFSGTIPKGNYGAGEVRIFDSGTYDLLEQEPGKVTVRLNGKRIQGVYHLVRPKPPEHGKDEWFCLLKEQERKPLEELPQPLPMKATLVTEAFDDDRYIFEPKWDGIRAIAVCSDSTVLLSRNQRDITATYPELSRVHERLVALEAMVDGEIVAFDDGRPSFERLQGRMNLQDRRAIEKAMSAIPVVYVIFDVLYLDGNDITRLPLEERKSLLEELVVVSDHLQVSPVVDGEGTALYDATRERRLEGIVGKLKTSPYRPGKRTREWLKVKATHEADLVIGGWTHGEGARSSTFGSLLVGAYDDDGLRFAGLVGTGFSDKMLAELVPQLHAIKTDECPFVEDPTGSRSHFTGKVIRNPQWVEPELVARVEFRELTSGFRLRAPSFKGLHPDKDPLDCRSEDLEPQ